MWRWSLFILLALPLFFAAASPDKGAAGAAATIADSAAAACSSEHVKDARHRLTNGSSLVVDLHHPRSRCSPAAARHADIPFASFLAHDDARARSLASRVSRTRFSRAHALRSSAAAAVGSSKVTSPLTSGDSIGVGNYVSRVSFGSPPKSQVVVFDTGSSLSWIQCSPCIVSCHQQVDTFFKPSSSSTYLSVGCKATACTDLDAATLNPSDCSDSGVCIYTASYGDGSYSQGYLSQDTLTFGNQAFSSFVFGCGEDNEGLFGNSDGLVGMARNKLSLLFQLAPRLGNAFSYCLSTAAGTGYLSIGSYSAGQFSYTPLLSSSSDGSLYLLKLSGITVAGKSLPVSSAAYSSLPTIIDSGTVISRLPTSVYKALSKAVAAALRGYATAPAYSILDTCYKGSLSKLKVPDVSLVFQGGATLKLPAENVFYDVDSSTTCLAFAPSDDVGIIGNTQQQTFAVVYDVGQSKIGFSAGGCR